MNKQVEKITIEPNSGGDIGTVTVEIYFDSGKLPDIQLFLKWNEVSHYLEDRFYSREGKLFYGPERG